MRPITESLRLTTSERPTSLVSRFSLPNRTLPPPVGKTTPYYCPDFPSPTSQTDRPLGGSLPGPY